MHKLNNTKSEIDDFDDFFEGLGDNDLNNKTLEFPGKKGLQEWNNIQGDLGTPEDIKKFYIKVRDLIDEHTHFLVIDRREETLKELIEEYLYFTDGTRLSHDETEKFKGHFNRLGIDSVTEFETRLVPLISKDFLARCSIQQFNDNLYYLYYDLNHKFLFEIKSLYFDNLGMYFKSDFRLDCDSNASIEDIIDDPDILLKYDTNYQRKKKIDQLLG